MGLGTCHSLRFDAVVQRYILSHLNPKARCRLISALQRTKWSLQSHRLPLILVSQRDQEHVAVLAINLALQV
jgi:hypothetical protein